MSLHMPATDLVQEQFLVLQSRYKYIRIAQIQVQILVFIAALESKHRYYCTVLESKYKNFFLLLSVSVILRTGHDKPISLSNPAKVTIILRT